MFDHYQKTIVYGCIHERHYIFVGDEIMIQIAKKYNLIDNTAGRNKNNRDLGTSMAGRRHHQNQKLWPAAVNSKAAPQFIAPRASIDGSAPTIAFRLKKIESRLAIFPGAGSPTSRFENEASIVVLGTIIFPLCVESVQAWRPVASFSALRSQFLIQSRAYSFRFGFRGSLSFAFLFWGFPETGHLLLISRRDRCLEHP